MPLIGLLCQMEHISNRLTPKLLLESEVNQIANMDRQNLKVSPTQEI